MSKVLKFFTMALFAMATVCSLISCSNDTKDAPTSGNSSILGTWSLTQEFEEEDGMESVDIVLVFNNNQTGSIKETWRYESRAATTNVREMEFSWSTVSDSDGNQILQVSYVSGDKNTSIFNGSENTALWKREFVLTGNILNIYSGNGVWVFNKK